MLILDGQVCAVMSPSLGFPTGNGYLLFMWPNKPMFPIEPTSGKHGVSWHKNR